MSDPIIVPKVDAGLVNGKVPGEALGPVMSDASNKVPVAQIPAAAITDVFVVADQAEMLALDAEVGDVAKRTDLGKSFILMALPASTLGNWVAMVDDVVSSVDGNSGDVDLSGSYEPLGSVSSHNGAAAAHGTKANSNPHNHDRYTDGEADARVAVHGNLTNNPHGVTAAQAGAAALVHAHAPSDVTGTAVITTDPRLSDARTPTSHTHGNVTNDGKVGSTPSLPLKTGTSGVIEAGAFGSGSGQFCEGNDARLSDARTPTAHVHAASDVNSGTLDGDRLPALSTTKKGGVPATGTPSGKFLKDDNTWATPTFGAEQQGFESEAESSTTSGTLQDKINQNTTSLPAGTYRFEWYAELYTDTGSNRECEGVVELAGTKYALLENVPGVATLSVGGGGTWTRMKSALSGFKVLTLTAGAKTVKIQFRRTGSSGTAYIANARIHLWRVA